jgi:hypothetical protein
MFVARAKQALSKGKARAWKDLRKGFVKVLQGLISKSLGRA